MNDLQHGGHLARLINDLAYERGWSLREVARRCDLPPATVQKVAAGGVTPKKETLEALAYGLSVPLTTLLEAAAQDSGYVAYKADGDAVSIVIAGLRELPPLRQSEVAALVRAMLDNQRA